MHALKEYPLSQLSPDALRVWGRTNGSLSPLTLFWTGSALELNVKGSELWLEVESDFSTFEQWAAVVVNGDVIARMPLPVGRHWLCIFRGMAPDKVKNIRFVKEIQPMGGDGKSLFQLHGLRTDGELLPVPALPRKIEFVGDSITSGEGLVGAKAEQDWRPMFFSAVCGYPCLTAALCNAEYRQVSQCGWGVLSGWDNTPDCTIPRIYGQICGPLEGPGQRELGAQEAYGFAAWQPDAVVINLGTNDAGARRQPPWEDAAGQSFQQTGDMAGQALFRGAVVEFLKDVRQKNPRAWLVWAYGMLGREMVRELREAIHEYKKEAGDQKVEFLLLPATTDETMGSRGHSGKKAHAQAAEVLADFLKTMWGE